MSTRHFGAATRQNEMTTKLRAVLKGHKGAVTRISTKFDAIRDESVSNPDDLQTMEETLRQKLQTIMSLHEKILDSLPDDNEDEIEAEVLDQEDYIYDLQSKITAVSNYRKVTCTNLNVNSQVFPVPSPVVEDIQQINRESTQETPVPLLSHSPVPPETISYTPRAPQTSHSSVFNRLPKLDLPKFDGSLLQWQSFWDSYESAVHTNPLLSGVQKFNYLKSTLRGQAVQTIAGFSLTNANYDKAVTLLHERYGKKDKIVQTYMTALLDVPAPQCNVTGLRHFYDTTETYIRGLDSLGQSECTYGSLLTPVILQKVPPEIRQHMTRAHGNLTWCLSDVMECLSAEISILEAGSPLDSPLDFTTSTSSFLTKSEHRRTEKHQQTTARSPKAEKEKKCVYCTGQHSSVDCKKVTDIDQRTIIVKKKQLCFNCLGSHRISSCKSRFKCKVCARRHHTSLCMGHARANVTQDTGEEQNAKDTHTSVLHSAHTFPTGPVLLKTAVASVTSGTTSGPANILFDEGSQSSFVTEQLANRLELKPTGRETLCLSGFGDKERHVRHLDTATICLQTPSEQIPLQVLIVPEISVPIKTYRSEVKEIKYLKGLQLAHPLAEDENFNIEMLVGANH